MPGQKIFDYLDNPIGNIFKKIVAGIVEEVPFSLGKTSAPFVVVIHVEDEIVPPPQDQHGNRGQCGKVPVHPVDDMESRITGYQGDVLDEAQGGQPVFRAVIGCQQTLFDFRGQPISRCHVKGPSGKQVSI